MKVALVHDYLREYGGAERVVEVLHEMWPTAPLYTSFVDWEALGEHAKRFKEWDIRPSWVQQNAVVKKFHSPLRFLAPNIWESFDLSHYDLVISSSGWYMCRGVAKKLSVVSGQLSDTKKQTTDNRQPTTYNHPVHICYIHHPPRNLYGYPTGSTLQKYPLVKLYTTIINFFLRHYDFDTAQRVDYFVANSEETARRVKKFYRRESTVIYPPVDVERKKGKGKMKNVGEYYLCVGRLTYSKRIDLAIEACNERKLPLKIVGTGKEEASLRQIAGSTIEFMGSVSDEKLDELYANAKALLFCALDEDFGMVPVEAMAHGVPVIALAQGGVKETVIHNKTGMLFDHPDVNSLTNALQQFEKNSHSWKEACMMQANKFSKERFKKEFAAYVTKKMSAR